MLPKNMAIFPYMREMRIPDDTSSSMKNIWATTYINGEDKQMAQFFGTLRARPLTWFMNFIDMISRI
jgi:hypothetical protein